MSGKIAACWRGPGIWGWKGACAHPARSCNKPWYCVSPPGVFSCPLYMAPCLWFGVARDEARAINRNMIDERLAKRNREEVLDTESKASQGTTNQYSCHRTQGQHQGSLDRQRSLLTKEAILAPISVWWLQWTEKKGALHCSDPKGLWLQWCWDPRSCSASSSALYSRYL